MNNEPLMEWILRGCPPPPPHEVKVATILNYLKTHNIRNFVETGTGTGETVSRIAATGVSCTTIELDEKTYQDNIQRFCDLDCTFLLGDSGELLKGIVGTLMQPTLFWLDAHYSYDGKQRAEKETPILEELGYVLASDLNHVILIDDARLFEADVPGKYRDYPKLAKLRKIIRRLNRRYDFECVHDMIRLCVPKGHTA